MTAKENIPTPPLTILERKALTMWLCSDEVWGPGERALRQPNNFVQIKLGIQNGILLPSFKSKNISSKHSTLPLAWTIG